MNFRSDYNRPFGKIFTVIIESKGAKFNEIAHYTEIDKELLRSKLNDLEEAGVLTQNTQGDQYEYYVTNNYYREWKEFDGNIKSQIISGISTIFSHERADSLLTRSFPECSEINHKTDCIVHILQKSADITDLFFTKVESIIRLHSNSIISNSNLLVRTNKLLKDANLQYNPDLEMIQPIGEETMVPSTNKLIEIDQQYIPDPFYQSLIEEINRCYSVSAYTGVSILVRKLLENIILDLLRRKFHKTVPGLYWDGKYFLMFKDLRKNLQQKKDDFSPYSPSIDKKFFGFLRKFQSKGNETAHNIELLKSNEFIDSTKEELIFYLNVCFKVMTSLN